MFQHVSFFAFPFQKSVKCHTISELQRSGNNWLTQDMDVTVLRPLAVEALKDVCRQTNILEMPQTLPEEAVRLSVNAKKQSISLQGEHSS